jgi:hypothetical protein
MKKMGNLDKEFQVPQKRRAKRGFNTVQIEVRANVRMIEARSAEISR